VGGYPRKPAFRRFPRISLRNSFCPALITPHNAGPDKSRCAPTLALRHTAIYEEATDCRAAAESSFDLIIKSGIWALCV
jgi:hypothetical protein